MNLRLYSMRTKRTIIIVLNSSLKMNDMLFVLVLVILEVFIGFINDDPLSSPTELPLCKPMLFSSISKLTESSNWK